MDNKELYAEERIAVGNPPLEVATFQTSEWLHPSQFGQKLFLPVKEISSIDKRLSALLDLIASAMNYAIRIKGNNVSFDAGLVPDSRDENPRCYLAICAQFSETPNVQHMRSLDEQAAEILDSVLDEVFDGYQKIIDKKVLFDEKQKESIKTKCSSFVKKNAGKALSTLDHVEAKNFSYKAQNPIRHSSDDSPKKLGSQRFCGTLDGVYSHPYKVVTNDGKEIFFDTSEQLKELSHCNVNHLSLTILYHIQKNNENSRPANKLESYEIEQHLEFEDLKPT